MWHFLTKICFYLFLRDQNILYNLHFLRQIYDIILEHFTCFLLAKKIRNNLKRANKCRQISDKSVLSYFFVKVFKKFELSFVARSVWEKISKNCLQLSNSTAFLEIKKISFSPRVNKSHFFAFKLWLENYQISDGQNCVKAYIKCRKNPNCWKKLWN